MKVSRLLAFCTSAFLLSTTQLLAFPSCEQPEMRLLCIDTVRGQFDHCFVTIACGADVFACRGGPAHGSGGGGRADLPMRGGVKGGLLFGKLRTGCARYNERHPDWVSDWKNDRSAHVRIDLLAKYPQEISACIRRVFVDLIDGCVAYDPLPKNGIQSEKANSNSAIATALHWCGMGGIDFPSLRPGKSPGDLAIIDIEKIPCGTEAQRADRRYRQVLQEVGELYLRRGESLFSRPELKKDLSQAVIEGRARVAREEAEVLKNALKALPETPDLSAPSPPESPALAPGSSKKVSSPGVQQEVVGSQSGGKSPVGGAGGQ